MYGLSLTLNSIAENLALDEALLDSAEAGEIDASVLRLWESPDYGVVLGRSSDAEVEVDLATCRRDGIPVYRRNSGGGTVVIGPGCLMYALVLDFNSYPQVELVDEAHRFVLSNLVRVIAAARENIALAGVSDLVMQSSAGAPDRKFSGNAMRRKRRHILYHGTFMYNFDLSKITRWLATPTRTPDYRADRPHEEFVGNLPISKHQFESRLCNHWQADTDLPHWPQRRTKDLVKTKYCDDPKWVIHPSTN